MIELTYNWDPEEYTAGRNFGHLAFSVTNIYDTCRHLDTMGIPILRPLKMGVWHLLSLRMAYRLNYCKKGQHYPLRNLGQVNQIKGHGN